MVTHTLCWIARKGGSGTLRPLIVGVVALAPAVTLLGLMEVIDGVGVLPPPPEPPGPARAAGA
jgi:hypothetical protein